MRRKEIRLKKITMAAAGAVAEQVVEDVLLKASRRARRFIRYAHAQKMIRYIRNNTIFRRWFGVSQNVLLAVYLAEPSTPPPSVCGEEEGEVLILSLGTLSHP